MRGPGPALLLCLAAALASALFTGVAPAANDVRTLVVRGRVLQPDGAPVAGARITARGALSVSATTDERGRYSLSLPIGSPSALRRGAFRLEIRAEAGGRRYALVSGGPALALEAACVPGTARLRVRSNSALATAAVVTAFAQDNALTAWVDADFGGAARASGSPALTAVDEVTLSGAAAPGAEPVRDQPQQRASAPKRLPPVPTPTPRPVRVTPPPSDSVGSARGNAGRDSLALARRLVARARRDSLAAARTASSAPRPGAAVEPRSRAADAAPGAGVSESRRPVASAPERVVPTEAFAPPVAESIATDSCSCTVRGTVEGNWARPPEKDIPVTLKLEGRTTRTTEVALFMGSPREFRLGPLPCGDYRLVVRPQGRSRYALVRGDSVVTVPCHGSTQVRVVLEALRR